MQEYNQDCSLQKMNLEFLLTEKQTLINQYLDKSTQHDLFYQERDFYSIQKLKIQLIDELIAIANKSYRSKIFQSFTAKYKNHLTSLVTFTTCLISFVQQNQALQLIHRHHTSQSLLLAFLLSKVQNKKVILISDYSQIARNCQIFEREGELDKVSFVQSCLSQQNIQFIDLSLKKIEKADINPTHIVILDLFGIELPKYFLLVVQNFNKLKNSANLCLYYSEHQLSDIQYLLKQLQKKNGYFQSIRLELNPPHPVQIHQCENYSSMFQKIFSFIQNISRFAEKQDIIIYYPMDEPLYKFIRRFKQQALKASSKDSYQLITAPNQDLSKQKVNIFLVKNQQELRRWRYDYSKVFMIQDFGYQNQFLFDYDIGCYLERVTTVTLKQIHKRMLWMGSDRCGFYYYLTEQTINSANFLDCYSQISSLLVRAIHYGHLQLIDLQNSRVKKCLKYLINLKIIQVDHENNYKIGDKRYIEYIEQNITPEQTSLMLKVIDDEKLLDKNKKKYLNLVAMAISVINSEGSLRKLKQEIQGSLVKPYAVWRRSGYIQSCLEILTKCELIQSRKHGSASQEFRRKTSKTLQSNHDLYEKNQVKRKKNFEQMDVNDLISDYTVNEDLLHTIRDKVQQLRFAFQFEMIPILIDKESVNKVIRFLMTATVKDNVGLYTGSKDSEYYNGNQNIFLWQNCLFYILNQRPQMIKIVRMVEIQGKKAIIMANTVHKDIYLQIFGELPVFQRFFIQKPELNFDGPEQIPKQALQVSKQFKLQNICSAISQLLVKDNGKLITQFQQQNNCLLNLQIQSATITIKCFKDEIQNKTYIIENINFLVKKLNQICKNYNKKLHYMGKLNFVLCQGGKILDILDKDQISRCILKDLPLEIAKEYIQAILQGHTLKNIDIIAPSGYDTTPSAIIEFYSRKAFENFVQDYRVNLNGEVSFKLQPLKDSEFNKLKNKQQQNQLFGNGRSTLVFKWYTWKSHGKAQVKFKNQECLNTAFIILNNQPKFDRSEVTYYQDQNNKLLLNIQNLSKQTDQIFIANALGAEGDIQFVQILKTPLKQTLGDVQHIGHLIKIGAKKEDFVKHKILLLEKKEFGLRVAKIALAQNHLINQITENLNKRLNLLGQGRVYVQPLFQRQILIPEGCLEIYCQLYQDLLISLEKQKPKIRYEIREDQQNIYMVLMSSIQQTLLYILAKFKQKLGGVKIQFPYSAKNIILNEIGVANFLDMQQKYNCKFIISVYSQKIKVVAKHDKIKAIQKQVQDRINNHFFYKVPLTSKNYKYYQNNLQSLTQLQKKFELYLALLQQDNFSILLEGNVLMIKQAVEWIYAKAKSQTQTKGIQIQQGQICGICCDKIDEPYLLFCQHQFCRQCLVDYLRYSLGDMSMFPLKCPSNSCRKEISCIDLENLFEIVDWFKIKTITANEFLKNNQEYTYCMTPGCQQINKLQMSMMDGIQSEFMKCDVCKSTFCLKCNAAYHPGRSCDEAKISQDQLMKKFISDQGVRKCPGKKCKALVTRYTGCLKVQCSRCSTCMCFKCPADNMAFFRDARQCYQHLNAIHGGYY